MKKKTPFRIAAERFAMGIYEIPKPEKRGHYRNAYDEDQYGCCEVLFNKFDDQDGKICQPVGSSIKREFFQKMFMPDSIERQEFKIHSMFWMISKDRTAKQNRNDRILALLFCEQLWLDENKSK